MAVHILCKYEYFYPFTHRGKPHSTGAYFYIFVTYLAVWYSFMKTGLIPVLVSTRYQYNNNQYLTLFRYWYRYCDIVVFCDLRCAPSLELVAQYSTQIDFPFENNDVLPIANIHVCASQLSERSGSIHYNMDSTRHFFVGWLHEQYRN